MLTRLLAYWIVANLTFITLWDVSILAVGVDEPTVSYFLYLWGRRFPLVYLWIGVAIGHLMMPLVVNPSSNGSLPHP